VLRVRGGRLRLLGLGARLLQRLLELSELALAAVGGGGVLGDGALELRVPLAERPAVGLARRRQSASLGERRGERRRLGASRFKRRRRVGGRFRGFRFRVLKSRQSRLRVRELSPRRVSLAYRFFRSRIQPRGVRFGLGDSADRGGEFRRAPSRTPPKSPRAAPRGRSSRSSPTRRSARS
jgi:hypothetical protein